MRNYTIAYMFILITFGATLGYMIGEFTFVFIVGILIIALTIMNALSQYQSRKRARQFAVKRNFVLKQQAKVIPLPKNGRKTSSHITVREMEADLV